MTNQSGKAGQAYPNMKLICRGTKLARQLRYQAWQLGVPSRRKRFCRRSPKTGLVASGYQAGGATRYQLDEILKTKYGDQVDKVGLVVGADMTSLVARGIKP
ncbi:unnamed protein product [Linum trigynum]|uniref:Uncharacterized protein n=1 Tax=Linum trigynum TaxID=586398 RepID=A0AAV2GSX2_9ROSI